MPGQSVCQVVVGTPNVVESNVISTPSGVLWTGLAWPRDQISEVTINNLALDNSTIQLGVRIVATSGYQGYLLNIGNGTSAQAALFRADSSSSFTQLGSTVTGLTFASGDVWTLQIAGSVISVYQNGNRVMYFADATYTTGSPSFTVNAVTTNLNHAQVSSWRGYNCVQQDGIWQKQGIVIPITSADTNVYQVTRILYEGNAQILSGTVYKTWFTSDSGTHNIYYAESLDGKTWVRSASPVLLGYLNSSVTKIGTTYYMYAQLNTGGPIALLTSVDFGQTWALQSANVLTVGAAGQWDDGSIFLLVPVVTTGSTWKALYTGTRGAPTNFLYSTGLATSTDNGLTWSKYAGNPVLVNAATTQAIVNVGGVYYYWPSSGPTSPRYSGGSSAYAPAETVRYQSADLLTWVGNAHSIHHSQMYESVNETTGGATTTAIIDVGGKAYIYGINSPGDAITPADYQIGLAIAPAPIASIVAHPEDAVQQVASDSFTSGLGNLSANWSTPTGGTKLQIVNGNLVEASVVSTSCSMYYSGAIFGAAQYSEITIAALTATGQYAEPCVRMQSGVQSDYEVQIQGPTGSLVAGCQVYKRVSGVPTAIGPLASITLIVGDVIRLQVETGSDGFPVLSVFQNGSMILQVQDYSNAFTSGSPGMLVFATTLADAQISSWAGGNANVIPAYLGGGSTACVRRKHRRKVN